MAAPPPVLAVMTPSLEGQRILRYIGIVAGEAILGTGFGQDLTASLLDLTGGRVSGWEAQIQQARYTALTEMCRRAQSAGANAVVGAALDYEFVGQGGSIVFVSATGTAVVAEPLGP
jgi:uncharacterized protein YbjQ (UPF0145 family)